ncbi:MAG: JAB domain-containing protein [Bacteroidales bacterium]|nr:JAB domain-containing protein [Bacteroidales bacterium]
MEAKKLNRLGFRFSEDQDINLLSLITEKPDLIDDLSYSQKEKIRILHDIIQEYYTSIDTSKKTYISDSEDVVKLLYPIVKGLDQTECRIIYLNRQNRVITKEVHTSGSYDSYIIDLKTILRRSLETKASGIIIVTNRPDDNVEPYNYDIEITTRISKATKLLGINLLDHVIISASSYHSISDHQTHTLTPERLNILQEG